ncbi:MAG: BamA/TamA family outer membrane protein [bacterium]|nr:BamA/TamA family outer membrane protein [bacterium]
MSRLLVPVLIIVFLASAVLLGAEEGEKKYITVVPGKHYKAGKLFNVFFGAHWRDLWTTPVKVEVLDLDRFAGGLTPLKRGGGQQTKSLRLQGKDGNEWKFRSVDKDPANALPPELRVAIATTVLQDQVSTANPMAPLVLAPILNAVGILQSEPYLVWMPDDERLGEFRKDFGGVLGMIEIHPKGRDEDSEGFEGAKRILSSFKLIKRLEKERDEQVDAAELLKARLVDVFVGDWDRHSDQWRWAYYKKGGRKLWKPIPRDRDQAFAKFDGLFPRLTAYLVIHLCSFDKNFPPARDITWSGRFIDRRFLPGLDRATWKATTAFVKSKLTDDVIEAAVKRLPPEIYEKASAELLEKLKHRRDHLTEVSGKYYKEINKVIDIFTGDLDDMVEVNRISEKKTVVGVFKRGKKSGGKKGRVLFNKMVDNRLTSEIRVHLGEGDDKVVIRGTVNSGPMVRVIGGDGKDEFIDESKVKGYFLKFTPFPRAETKSVFYDSGKKTVLKRGPGTKMIRKKVPKPANDFEKYESRQRNRGHEWYGAPLISLNTEDGLVVGAMAMHYKYGFRMKPYKYFLSMNASYASGTSSYHIALNGVFNTVIPGTSLHLSFLKTQLLFNDYYGFGNETDFDAELAKADYYETEEEFTMFRPSLRFKLFKNVTAGIGLGYTASDIALDRVLLLRDTPHYRYGLGKFASFDVNTTLTYDTRDNPANARKGFFLELDGSYTPDLLDSRYNFVKAGFDARVYFSMKAITDTTLAFRVGGGKVWGDYPFFNAVFLGGGADLRGFNKKRFSGDAALFGQAELRAYLMPVTIFFPGKLGFHLFSDAGRVFVEGESSDKWHSSYGGGIWVAFVKRMFNVSFTLAKSDEKSAFYFGLRLMY